MFEFVGNILAKLSYTLNWDIIGDRDLGGIGAFVGVGVLALIVLVFLFFPSWGLSLVNIFLQKD